jgi:hypothetical protein
VVLGAISLDLFAVLLGGATALLPIFAKDILHVGPWGLGLLRAAPAVGALAMSLWLTRWPIARGAPAAGCSARWRCTAWRCWCSGCRRAFWLSMAALAVGGAADMVSVVIRQTLVQLETPDAMRGRVSAVNSVFIGASNQLGEFESGATAAWLGPVGSVLLGGVGTLLVAGLWLKLFPALAQRDELVEAGTAAEPGHGRRPGDGQRRAAQAVQRTSSSLPSARCATGARPHLPLRTWALRSSAVRRSRGPRAAASGSCAAAGGTPSRTAQPGSASCVQSRKRHCGQRGTMSSKAPATRPRRRPAAACAAPACR